MSRLAFKQLQDGTQAVSGSGTLTIGTGSKLAMADLPTSGNHLANKTYVDSVAAGLDPKASCLFTTYSNIGGTYAAGGGTGASGAFTGVDLTDILKFDLQGFTVAIGNRILIKNQSDAKQNGIYVVTTAGATGAIERASDQDGTPANEVSPGNFTFISHGDDYASTGWVLVGDGGVNQFTLNTDDINWQQFSAGAAYTGGDGIVITAFDIDIDLATTSGLEFSGGQLRVNQSDGIVLDSNGVKVNLTSLAGLQFTGAAGSGTLGLKLESNGGIVFDGVNGGIEIKPDVTTGATVAQLTVGTNGAGVTVDNTTITHTAGTLSVGSITASQVSDFTAASETAIFTTANFVDSALIDFTVTAGASVTATVIDGSIAEVKLDATNTPTNGQILSYNSGGSNFTWISNTGSTPGLTRGTATASAGDDSNIFTDIFGANNPSTIAIPTVFVNGLKQTLGDGVLTQSCYFGTVGGTALAFSALTGVENLYWNETESGFTISGTDIVEVYYEIQA